MQYSSKQMQVTSRCSFMQLKRIFRSDPSPALGDGINSFWRMVGILRFLLLEKPTYVCIGLQHSQHDERRYNSGCQPKMAKFW